jgi:hypothetical protein
MFRKLGASVAIGGALLGGLAMTGTAYAATPTPAASASPSHATKGQLKHWLRTHRKEIRKAGLDISAQTIGVSPQVLATDLKAGNSIAGVATQHGVSTQTVVNALVTAADGKINQAVSSGKLTQTEANAIEAKVPSLVSKAVDHTF